MTHTAALRARLRALPSFPTTMPTLDLDQLPADPLELTRRWLDDAIATGERQPHAVTFTTIDEDNRPRSRMLVVKDVDARGVLLASSRDSRKAQHLAIRPVATIHAFWRPLGRQLEISGTVDELDDAASLTDWRARPGYDGIDNPQWRVWALRPDRVEAMQATHDRCHVRVEYLLRDDGWYRRRLDQH